jgi:diguanylate cyclase (GGDEF)-like protein
MTADLVGTKAAAGLQADRPLTVALTRQIVASALDVDESALSAADDGALQHALARLRKIAQTIERLAATAATDELTGILRRGPGMLALQREIDRESRRKTHGIVVVFVDVDGLKRTNDSRGHAAGDQLLRDVVTAIRSRIRSYDLVFRYGGDEFVIGLLDVAPAQAEQILDEIRQDIADRTGGSTVSAGAATVEQIDSAEEVVARADGALYRERGEVRRVS